MICYALFLRMTYSRKIPAIFHYFGTTISKRFNCQQQGKYSTLPVSFSVSNPLNDRYSSDIPQIQMFRMYDARNEHKFQLIFRMRRNRTTEIIQVPINGLTPKIFLHSTLHFRQLCLLHKDQLLGFHYCNQGRLYLPVYRVQRLIRESVNRQLISWRDKLSINQSA